MSSNTHISLYKLNNLQTLQQSDQISNVKELLHTTSSGSAFTQPVRPVYATGQTGLHGFPLRLPVRPVD